MNRTIVSSLRKDEVTFVRTSAETDGELTELDVKLMPGGGLLLHDHNTISETFTALEGKLGLEVGGGKKMWLSPGESFTAKAGTLHRFFNDSNDAIRFRTEVRPGSKPFEDTLRIGYGLERDGQCNQKGTPKNLYHLAVCVEKSDSCLPGVMSLFAPLLMKLAKKARAKGIDKELESRYCV